MYTLAGVSGGVRLAKGGREAIHSPAPRGIRTLVSTGGRETWILGFSKESKGLIIVVSWQLAPIKKVCFDLIYIKKRKRKRKVPMPRRGNSCSMLV